MGADGKRTVLIICGCAILPVHFWVWQRLRLCSTYDRVVVSPDTHTDLTSSLLGLPSPWWFYGGLGKLGLYDGGSLGKGR